MDTGGNGELGPEVNWNEVNLSISGGWTPLDSVVQNVERTFPVASCGQTDNSSFNDILQNQGTSRTSHLVQFQSYCSLAGLEPNLSCFGSASVSEMDNFFIQQRCHTIANFGYSTDYPKEESGNKTDKPSQPKNMKTDQEKDQCIAEQDKEKLKAVRKPDAPKEDYVPVRAQRGQATTRHSLAERVRREKIRERMKYLQDLVPGCSKITGKAVMLDEIINYVISLQRQVEFLSTKLATAYPEMNVDLEQTLSRDIHLSQGSSAAILGDLGRSSYPKEMQQGALLDNQTKLEPPNMPSLASIWDNEHVNTSQMDFIRNPTLHNPDFNDCDEVEL